MEISNIYRFYGFLGFIRLSISLILTKIFFKKSRIIRFPYDIRGKKNIDFGTGLTTGYNCRIEAYNKNSLKFGMNIQINDYVHIAAGYSIVIGDDTLIASRVYISDIVHGNYIGVNQDSPYQIPGKRNLSYKPVYIGKNVWIGEGVSILPGVVIGDGCIIGANTVVTKNIPENCIVAGIPAKIIKKYDIKKKEWIKV